MGTFQFMDIAATIQRIIDVLKLKSQKDLADFFHTSPSTISSAIVRKKIPEGWLYRVAYETQCRVEWLRTGKGSIYLDEAISEARAIYGVQALKAVEGLMKYWPQLNEDSRRIGERCIEALTYSEDRDMLSSIAETVIKKHEYDNPKYLQKPKKPGGKKKP